MEVSYEWLDAIQTAFHRLETRWEAPPKLDPDFYDYHALPVAEFLPVIESITQFTSGRQFLDVGCGLGTNLALMQALGWEVSGIEWNKEYAFAARGLVPEAQILIADLRDVESFDADVVYMYHPAKSDELENEVEAHVAAHCKSGTVLFFPNSPQALECERLGRSVWRC